MRFALRSVGVVIALAIAGALLFAALRDDSTDAERASNSTGSTSTFPTSAPVEEAEEYLAAWEQSDWDTMAALVKEPPADFADQHEEVIDDLRAESVTLTRGAISLESSRASNPATPPGATVPFTASVSLVGLGQWEYEGSLAMVGTREGWRVDWSPAAIHPAFALEGFDIRRSRIWPPRAPIVDRNEQPIVASTPVIEVGVEPRRIEDQESLASILEQQLGIAPEELDAALNAPGVRANFFVPLAQLSEVEWEAVREVVLPVPGVLIRDTLSRTPPSPDYARQTLGRVGEATAERLDELGAPYAVGDLVGFGGLEGSYEQRLAGAPTGAVNLIDDFGDQVDLLAEFPGTDGATVRTTVDPAIQLAAEAALVDIEQPAAIVAVDGAGEVRALVSRPVDGFHRGIGGRYPPGSTFKIVTSYALLSNGFTRDTVVGCPSTIDIGGRTFSNFEGGALGDIPFSVAFRESCNTAFMGSADTLESGELSEAAAAFSFESDYSIGLTTFPGRFPEPADRTEHAAAAIGQARVEASPLHMASVAAAIASDTWNPPVLVRDPAPVDSPASQELNPFATAIIRDLMVDVVTSGTGTAANVPGRVMGGKTGTAQFDTANPDTTHAWFVGWVELPDGPIGFAVLVEEGGTGGTVAAPIARDFVSLLP